MPITGGLSPEGSHSNASSLPIEPQGMYGVPGVSPAFNQHRRRSPISETSSEASYGIHRTQSTVNMAQNNFGDQTSINPIQPKPDAQEIKSTDPDGEITTQAEITQPLVSYRIESIDNKRTERQGPIAKLFKLFPDLSREIDLAEAHLRGIKEGRIDMKDAKNNPAFENPEVATLLRTPHPELAHPEQGILNPLQIIRQQIEYDDKPITTPIVTPFAVKDKTTPRRSTPDKQVGEKIISKTNVDRKNDNSISVLRNTIQQHRRITQAAHETGIKITGGISWHLENIHTQVDILRSSMERENSQWIQAQQRDLTSYLESLGYSRVMESYYRGLGNTVTLEYRTLSKTHQEGSTNLENPEYLRGLIQTYSLSFIKALKISRKFGIAPAKGLTIAEQSYHYSPNILFELKNKYPELPQFVITRAVVSNPINPEKDIIRFQTNVERLTPLFPNFPPSVITQAALRNPTDPEKFLRNVETKITTLSPQYPELPHMVIVHAAMNYPSNPEKFIKAVQENVINLSALFPEFSHSLILNTAIYRPKDPVKFLEKVRENITKFGSQFPEFPRYVIAIATTSYSTNPEAFLLKLQTDIADLTKDFPDLTSNTILQVAIKYPTRRKQFLEEVQSRIKKLSEMYPQIEQNIISFASLNYPTRPEEYIEKIQLDIKRLTKIYSDLPVSVVTAAAARYPTNPDRFLETVKASLEKYIVLYPDLSTSLIIHAAISHQKNPDEFLNQVRLKIQTLKDEYKNVPNYILNIAARYSNPHQVLDKMLQETERLSALFPSLPHNEIMDASLRRPSSTEQFLASVVENVKQLETVYKDLPNFLILRAVIHHPTNPQQFLSEVTAKISSLIPQYPTLRRSTIVYTAIIKPSNPEQVLDKIIEQSDRLTQLYPEFPQSVIVDACMGNPRRPEDFLEKLKKRKIPIEQLEQVVNQEMRDVDIEDSNDMESENEL